MNKHSTGLVRSQGIHSKFVDSHTDKINDRYGKFKQVGKEKHIKSAIWWIKPIQKKKSWLKFCYHSSKHLKSLFAEVYELLTPLRSCFSIFYS
jgi:hypothetical protein